MDGQQFLEQFQAMQATIQQQQSQLEALSNLGGVTLPQPKEVKVAAPEYFSGNRKRSRTFLLQLKNVFRSQPQRFSKETTKVTYAISFLRDTAFDWIAPFLECDHEILEDFDKFEDRFKLAFGDTDRQRQAEQELLRLKQKGRSASALVSDFQRLSMEVKWSSEALFSIFYQALNDEVKDEICKCDRPLTIDEYYKLAIRIDNRLFERRQERKSSSCSYKPSLYPVQTTQVNHKSTDSDAMVIGATNARGPLSIQEKQRRRRDGLCMYCGSGEHLLDACSIRPKGSKSTSQMKSSHRLVGETQNRDKSIRLYTPLQILLSGHKSHEVTAFVDSGSDCSFIDEDLVHILKLKPHPLKNLLTFEVIDGNPLPSGGSTSYVNCSLKIMSTKFRCKLFTIKTPHSPIVLGLDWLQRFNPDINWEALTLSLSNNAAENVQFQTDQADGKCKQNSNSAVEESCIASMTLEESFPDDNPAENMEDEVISTSEELEKIRAILPSEYHDFITVFSKDESEILPEHRKYDIAIEIQKDKKIPWGPIYALSNPELEALKTYIDENLAKGFIRPSSSPAGASLFFVKKKNGDLRPVVDYRALNSITVKNRYPLPLIQEMLHHFSKAKIFSKIDLRGAYNLVRVREGDEWKTAFRCRFGHYEYRVMPFGLTNAPAVFQYLMNDILHEYLDIFCIAYLDDILIFSETEEEHTIHVRKVLQCLKDNLLYAKLEKCKFSVRNIDFLGYSISDTGIGMDLARIDSIVSWPSPTSVKELQSFLGFSNFYRMFIANYSLITTPLLHLLKKSVKFEWTPDCEEAFKRLKKSFTSAPILRHPDTTQPFIVETDSSDYALGGILSQFLDGVLHPVAFYSRKLSSAEVNYEIYDKELLAIIACFSQWRALLLSNSSPITVYTDHRNLLYFSSAKKLNRRQVRWSLFLSDFNFNIVYRAGKEGESLMH